MFQTTSEWDLKDKKKKILKNKKNKKTSNFLCFFTENFLKSRRKGRKTLRK